MTLLGCCPKRTEPQWRLSVATLLLLLSMLSSRGVDSFQPVLLLPTASQFRTTAANSVRIPNAREDSSVKEKLSSSTSLNMFMGSDGGLLGVGGPEIVRRNGLVSQLEWSGCHIEMYLPSTVVSPIALYNLLYYVVFSSIAVHNLAGWIFCFRSVGVV